MMKTLPTLMILVLALTLSTSSLAGTVYRWVDDQGNVQFSETPPRDRDAEATDYRTGPRQQPAIEPIDEEAADATADEAEEDPLAPDPEEQLTEDVEAVDPEELAQQHQERCEAAREGLRIIEESPRLRVQEDGEYRFLEPDEVEAKREEYQEAADESCGWSAG